MFYTKAKTQAAHFNPQSVLRSIVSTFLPESSAAASSVPTTATKPPPNAIKLSSILNANSISSNNKRYIDTPDHYRFHSCFASYCHHGMTPSPVITSLLDLTDNNSGLSLLPRRRLYGNPFETLSIKSGDDAIIVSPNMIGVADGVSGYSGEHADSGLFARSILENISRYFTELSLKHSDNLKRLSDSEILRDMDLSFQDSLKVMEFEKLRGSSTLLVGMIIDTTLKVLSLGDSKIFVIRDKQIAYTNKEQYISVMCPQQVGTNFPEKLPSKVVEITDIQLQNDDIILICSDGLTDNMYPDEILQFINDRLNIDKTNLQQVTNDLLKETKSIAFDSYCVSPYVEKVNELHNQFIQGGKLDDISICISKVSFNEPTYIK